ncbi:MAG: hypothetical protein ACO1O1_04365 [Adhaeribacter sp.]
MQKRITPEIIFNPWGKNRAAGGPKPTCAGSLDQAAVKQAARPAIAQQAAARQLKKEERKTELY